MKTSSSLRASPVMTLGDKNEGRSAYNKQSENEEHVLARKRRNELWRQVYRLSLRDMTYSWTRYAGEIL